jgi:hypothetical protein
MRGTIRFYRPTGQQQTQNNAENQLFLLRQPFHADNVAWKGPSGKNGLLFAIYDIRFTRHTPCACDS